MLEILRLSSLFKNAHFERKNIASSSKLLLARVSFSRLTNTSEAQSDCKPVEPSPVWSKLKCLRFLIGSNPAIALKSSFFSFSRDTGFLITGYNGTFISRFGLNGTTSEGFNVSFLMWVIVVSIIILLRVENSSFYSKNCQ